MAYKSYVLICGGTGCLSSKADLLKTRFDEELASKGLTEDVQVVMTGCFGFCEKGPIVKVLPEETFYVHVIPEDVAELVAEDLLKGRVVERLLYKEGVGASSITVRDADKIKFYQKQVRIVLRNCGMIDPEKIDEYLSRDGYAALEKALFEMTPDDIINELKISGLRGRGGAGFPAWLKWNFSKTTESDQKYIVCNADEGDPGAYMDRSTLEGDPHSLIEAMAIAGYTVGANKGMIYIRAEYPLAIERLETAMAQARDYGLLGENILDSGFSFDLEIRLGAGAFVCGEETALLASIEGNRGMPTPKPPFPAVCGLWKKPTVINNVETWVNIPVILLKGGKWFASIGTEKSPGTKVFALTGKIKNSGLVEVPMGTTLREIIFDIGGGIPNGRKFKAVQTGGPSGGVITEKDLDTPIDFDNLLAIGSMMGSGGMIVMDEDDCIIDVSKFYQEFCVEESCGKCAPCRIGTKKLYDILDKITKGKGSLDDLAQIEEIGIAMKRAALCGLGQTAPNPILSSMHYFKDEYLAHINDHHCAAGKCKALVSYHVDSEKCVGCTLCAKKCPVSCIAGERKALHVIDQAACIKCGLCYTSCKFDAIIRA